MGMTLVGGCDFETILAQQLSLQHNFISVVCRCFVMVIQKVIYYWEWPSMSCATQVVLFLIAGGYGSGLYFKWLQCLQLLLLLRYLLSAHYYFLTNIIVRNTKISWEIFMFHFFFRFFWRTTLKKLKTEKEKKF